MRFASIKKINILLNLILLQSVFSFLASGETIIFQSGEEVNAKVVNEDNNSITVLDKKGFVVTYDKNNIYKIAKDEPKYSGGQDVDREPDEAKQTEEELKKQTELSVEQVMEQYRKIIKDTLQ